VSFELSKARAPEKISGRVAPVFVNPTKLSFTMLFSIAFSLFAEQPVTTYSRFCATCGIAGADTIASQSGQFVVHGVPGRLFAPAQKENEAPLIEAEPQLLAVTGERTRQAFLQELGLRDLFQDKVHVVVLPRARPEQPIQLVSHVYNDGFQYQLGVPAFLESSRMIKGFVQVVLQEFANRGSRRNAELPTWLVEGMNRQLRSAIFATPVLEQKPLVSAGAFLARPQVKIGFDRLGPTRLNFLTNSPLTIQELSFSNLPTLSERERNRYESSAHLFLYELLALRSGGALMAAFIQSLPHALNWQTAFYGVYRQFFHTPLDLEKWWMLRCVEIQNRQAHHLWNSALSLERLEALLRTPTEFRANTNSIPERRDATVQQVLEQFDFGVQKDILGQKLQQIFFISINLSPEVAPLAGAYEQAIETYLEKRALSDYQPGLKSDPEQRLDLLVKSTVKSFDQLDLAREDIRAGRTPKLPPLPKPRSASRTVILSRGNSQN
jgi:hypothetical protein